LVTCSVAAEEAAAGLAVVVAVPVAVVLVVSVAEASAAADQAVAGNFKIIDIKNPNF
jgi:hypothetical protein